MCRKISAHVDGGLSGGSRVRRPGSEDPHRREQKLYYYFPATQSEQAYIYVRIYYKLAQLYSLVYYMLLYLFMLVVVQSCVDNKKKIMLPPPQLLCTDVI